MTDLRFVLRTLLRSPGYTIVTVLTLVLGLGANTAVFSLVRGVLLAPLPYVQPGRLVAIREVSGGGREMPAAWRNFQDWHDRTDAFDGLFAYGVSEETVLGTGRPLRTTVAPVSADFTATMRLAPAQGRLLLAADHRRGAAPVAVVSDRFWRTHLAGAAVTGRTIEVAGFPLQIVGVMPPGFDFPGQVDVWYPLELEAQSEHRTAHNFGVIGRLAAGMSLARAEADLDAITRGFAAAELDPGFVAAPSYLDYYPKEVTVRTLHETVVGSMRRPLGILVGASLLLLLVACTNIASTSLARGAAREREFAVRHALGAARSRLVRLQLMEALVLACAGAALGFGLGAFALKLLPALAPSGLPRVNEIGLHPTAMLVTLVLAILAALVAGLLPGLRAARRAGQALRGGSRVGSGPGALRIWKALIAVEMAFAVLLLVGSGLLLRSFWTVLAVEPGYRTSGVLTATVNPPPGRYGDDEAKRRYLEELLGRLESVPGVASAGLIGAGPMSRVANGLVRARDDRELTADYQIATAGYFVALDIPLVHGRLFGPADRADAPHVAVVNRAFAAAAWPGEDAIGQRVTGGGMDSYGPDRWATVVGVVGDVRQRELTLAPAPTVYFSARQRPQRAWTMTAVLRPEAGSAAALTGGVRAAVAAVDPDVPVSFATMEQRVADTLIARRFMLIVIAVFAAIALLLAAVGVYGVVAYAVERRRREIGIRIALGARPLAVRRTMQRDYLVAAGAGALTGVLGALGLTRILASLLFEVQPTDPLTFAAVLATLGATAWLASFVPARRTTGVDPLETMKAD